MDVTASNGNVAVRVERYYCPHIDLMRIARHELQHAADNVPGCFHHRLIVLTFSALAVEALANAVAFRVFPNWEDIERKPTAVKIRCISKMLNLRRTAADPWSTLRALSRFRTLVAHGKPDPIDRTFVMPRAVYHLQKHDPPPSALEQAVTFAFAQASVSAVDMLQSLFCERLTYEQRMGIDSDEHSSMASPILG